MIAVSFCPQNLEWATSLDIPLQTVKALTDMNMYSNMNSLPYKELEFEWYSILGIRGFQLWTVNWFIGNILFTVYIQEAQIGNSMLAIVILKF